MKVTITGDALVVTSSLKVEDIKMLEKYSPESLNIKDEEGNDVFSIAYKEGCPSISKYGVTFSGKSRDGKDLATITLQLPTEVANVKEFVADLIGSANNDLKTLETELPTIIKQLGDDRKALIDSITLA